MCSLVEHCFPSQSGGEDSGSPPRGLSNIITNLKARQREPAQAPSPASYEGLRKMMEIAVGHSFYWRIHIAKIHVFVQGFSYLPLPLFQQRLPTMISAALFFPSLSLLFCFVWSTPGFCSDLCFLVIRADTAACRALVRATANQTQPQEMCEGTELDQLQRKNWRRELNFICFHFRENRKKQFLLPQY